MCEIYSEISLYDPLSNTGLHKSLEKLGFPPQYVAQALMFTNDKQKALDWLCLHVPERELPALYAPAKGNIQVVTASRASQSAQLDAASNIELGKLDGNRKSIAQSLLQLGYTLPECLLVLPQLQEEELKRNGLSYALPEIFHEILTKNSPKKDGTGNLEEIRSEEFVVLESILGDDFERY